MHALRVSRALLWGLVCVAVGCSSKPPEEKPLASSASTVASGASALLVGWDGTNSMAESRKYHAGVVLQSGKVLVTGGYKATGYLSSAEVYEPGTGWTAVVSMPEARQAHTATVLNTGKVLVAGGENATGRLSSAVVYDPATNTWASAGSFASGVARDWMTATLLPLSGKVLVAGGGNTGGAQSKVDVYDAASGTWAVGPSMRTPRRSHSATVLANGKVLVVGGWSGGATGAAEVYDPATNTWSATGALATARYDHTATLLPSGKVLVVGGRNGTNGSVMVGTAEQYDPSTGQWSAAGALGNARAQHTATLLNTGKVLVAGGLYGSAATNALASAEVYDPGTGQWSTVTAMGSARYLHVALALEAQGKVLAVGGVGSSGSSQKTAELYVYDACAGVSCNSAPGTCYEAAGTCSSGVCSYTPKAAGASCDDGNACTGADVCNGAGVCAGSATSCSSPPGQCYEEAGTCSNGACTYEYKAAGEQCDDEDACTVGEECNGAGGCAGTPVSCTRPPNTSCYEAAGTCSGGTCAYTPKGAGSPCDDGNAGTLNDACNGAGVCAGVVACTTPPSACHDSPGMYVNGACTYPLKAGGTACGAGRICDATGQCQSGCWIAGAYYAAGATNPGNPCQQCSPSVSTSSWSSKAVGATCGTPSYGSWGNCGGYSETCDETGSQSRTVTTYACTSSGTCAGTNSSQAQPCSRSTGGTWCNTDYSNCSDCDSSNYCDNEGTQSCTVTNYTCSGGTCQASYSGSETVGCWRGMEGMPCDTQRSCSECDYSETCDEAGTQDCSVENYTCSSGICRRSGTSYETDVACSRSTAGNVCDHIVGCPFWCIFDSDCATEGEHYCTTVEVLCGGGICNPLGEYTTYPQVCTRPLPPGCPP